MARRKSSRISRSGPKPGKSPKAMGNNPRRSNVASGVGRVNQGANMAGSTTKPPFVGGPTT